MFRLLGENLSHVFWARWWRGSPKSEKKSCWGQTVRLSLRYSLSTSTSEQRQSPAGHHRFYQSRFLLRQMHFKMTESQEKRGEKRKKKYKDVRKLVVTSLLHNYNILVHINICREKKATGRGRMNLMIGMIVAVSPFFRPTCQSPAASVWNDQTAEYRFKYNINLYIFNSPQGLTKLRDIPNIWGMKKKDK